MIQSDMEKHLGLSYEDIVAKAQEYIREKNPKAQSSEEVAGILRPILTGRPSEELWVLSLDNDMCITGMSMVSRGGHTQASAGARNVFREALCRNSAAVIVAHNHLKESALPSDADKDTTALLKKAGGILDVPVIDHIIIGEGDDWYYSFLGNETKKGE